jgi:DNA topoisomerase I
MRLRRSIVGGTGIHRVRRGRGFSYHDDDGQRVSSPTTLQRIDSLAIPPAWKNVWICTHPNGHIQAVGTDAAGRRQYLYNPQWHDERSEEKFDRVLELSAMLPDWRGELSADLKLRGLPRERVLAVGLRLLDLGYFRAGGDQYAEENNSFGIATLMAEHVTLHSGSVEFDYPAKSGVRRVLDIDDADTVCAIRTLRRSSGGNGRLLSYRNGQGLSEIHADDLNARFKQMVGDEYTVKDLRTWHGTVLAAAAFAEADPPVDRKVVKRVEAAVMREVAEELGNTAAVARSAYVDPRVTEAYREGLTIGTSVRRSARTKDADKRQAILERATARLIRKVAH